MEKKKGMSFVLLIVAVILGTTLYKQFDFETLRFEKTGLAVLYIIVFVTSVVLLIKGALGK
ncbi:MAG: hypothetical protein EOO92_10290 [Pedobacter sp.]|nr:MAG: hypothetical protein EOO92_10290 [Pedobacter sp.]